MEREAWTPWIGVQDIFAFLRKRAKWGAAIWLLALYLMLQADDLPRDRDRTVYMLACAGSLAASLVMTWKLEATHQWAGALPYLVTTLLILTMLIPTALVVHWIWPIETQNGLPLVLAMSALGVLLRGVASWHWMKPYWRGH